MNSPKFRGVFFDLDGTLLDTTPLIVKSFQHAFQTHYQRPVTLEDIQPYMGKPLRAAMEVMAPGEEDSVIATYRAFNHIHHDKLAGRHDPLAPSGVCSIEDPFGGYTPGINAHKGCE